MDKKISTSIIETYITIQEHQILHEKPFGTGKNHGATPINPLRKYIEITTIKLIPNLSLHFTINWKIQQ